MANSIDKLTGFTFNHKDQPDRIHESFTADQLKANFDSRAEEVNEKLNEAIDQVNTNATGVEEVTQNFNTHNENKANPHNVTPEQLSVYTTAEVDQKFNDRDTEMDEHKKGVDHDIRYYTKVEMDQFVRGGDTTIKYEVFTIINSNNGDGSFTYRNSKGMDRNAQITPEGYQVFTLEDGEYPLGENRINLTVDDTLFRNVASGGLKELNEWAIALTIPEANGAEITIQYFERLGLAGEHSLTHELGGGDEIAGLTGIGEAAPSNKCLWFKVVT